jgi:hypothetical protein
MTVPPAFRLNHAVRWVAAHPGVDFLIQPDSGAQGDVAGFCAALSP